MGVVLHLGSWTVALGVIVSFWMLRLAAGSELKRSYKTEYFQQKVDQFSFVNTDTFLQKYLISDEFWKPGVGPVFFYPGNEGKIELFSDHTGFMWEIAPEFNAMVIFAEHRYYGDSMPYGNVSFANSTTLGYLTAEQAMVDFAVLLESLKQSIEGFDQVPIIAFGGSYGGMLAAWMRMKYPHIIHGALASSAPIWQFPNITDCNAFNKIVTKDFAKESRECSIAIRKSWDIINKYNATDDGKRFLTETFHLCSPLKTEKDLKTLKSWLDGIYSGAAMVNYPYATDFLEKLPAWPIKEMCKHLPDSSVADAELLTGVNQVANVYFNFTGNMSCFNTSVETTSDVGFDGWEFQACTEMVMPFCADGVDDMFEPHEWDLEEISDDCFKKFKVRPNAKLAETLFGGKNITASSNIIFSNGELDPWSGGGVLESLSKSLVAIYIADSAHHLDLRSSHPSDPHSVVQARNLEKNFIREWISEYYNRSPTNP